MTTPACHRFAVKKPGVVETPGREAMNAMGRARLSRRTAERGARGSISWRQKTIVGRRRCVTLFVNSMPRSEQWVDSWWSWDRPLRHTRRRWRRGVLVLSVTTGQVLGEECVEEVRRELLGVAARAGASRVVLDLRAVKVAGGEMLRAVLDLQAWVRGRGGRMVVSGLVTRVAEALRIAGLAAGETELGGRA